jgi:hypothetical protein
MFTGQGLQEKKLVARSGEAKDWPAGAMKATQELHDLGQSLWFDNITRDLLDNGTLKRYIKEFSVTGLHQILRSLSMPYQRADPMTRRSGAFCP